MRSERSLDKNIDFPVPPERIANPGGIPAVIPPRIPPARRKALTRFILFREPHPACRDNIERYFGPHRLPGTAPIGLRRHRPELFQDTLNAEWSTYEEWLRRHLSRGLNCVLAEQQQENQRVLNEREKAAILQAAGRILEYPTEEGIPLQDAVPQQMYEDVFMRIIGLLLYPDHPGREVHFYRAFNALCHRLGLSLLNAMSRRNILRPGDADISRLIRVAVLSGYVGINLKSSASAASALLNRSLLSIPKKWAENLAMVASVSATDLTALADELLDLAESPERAFELDSFSIYKREVIDCSEPTLVVFFSDDYLESIIDLKRFEAMLDRNPRLCVLFVPRAGRYGNDLAFSDLAGILAEPPFCALHRHLETGRLRVSQHGPRAGCLDPRDVSRHLVDAIDLLGKDRHIIVETKGCRNFEMLQGRLPVPWYAAFNCNRALSIRTVEVDGPPVFLRIPPGLKAYDGFSDPRIGQSRSYGTAGVRFARMTTRNLYAGLNSPVYQRLSVQAGDEFELHAALYRWADAAGMTFPELMNALSAEAFAQEKGFEKIRRAITRCGKRGDCNIEPITRMMRRNRNGKD